MALIRGFLATYGDQLFLAAFPVVPLAKITAISIAILSVLSALSVLSIWVAGHLFDLLTPGINELEAIARGNVAMAVFFAFVLLAITAVLDQGVEGLSLALIPPGATGMGALR